MEQREQQQYYARTADRYDAMHLSETEHEIALAQLCGLVRYFGFESLLDVGAGTGRVLRHGVTEMPNTSVIGVEPIKELREIAYLNGVSRNQLSDGNAMNLDFADNSFDIVCAFGILHHIPRPEVAILEMCRVARYGIFFSDLNNFGCGSSAQRLFRHKMRITKLWKPFQWLKNGGKMEKYSEGDGIHYSYSLFDSLGTIRTKFRQIHLMNTKAGNGNLFWSSSHVSAFAVKDEGFLANRQSRAIDS